MSRSVSLLGQSFNDMTQAQALALLLARPRDAAFAYIVTPNADHLERLHRTPSLQPVYDAALLRLLDSRCLAHLARLLGQTPPPVVTGADLSAALLARLGGQRVAVVGLSAAGCSALRARYPSIDFRHHNPPMGLLHNQEAFAAAARFVQEAGAAYVFFALGAPVQELLAHAVMRAGGASGVGLCIGAALEFAAGTRRRAPLWMQGAGLEWLYRLVLEPRRLGGRYLIRSPRVLALLLAQASGFRAGSGR